jgi:transposase-like protein
MNKPSSEALALMRAASAKPAAPDKLDRLREKLKELRDIEMQRASLDERNAQLGQRVFEIKTKELVDLFDAAKVDNVGIPEEGNLPAYNMEIGWIYKANIGTPDDPKVDDYGAAITYIRKTEPDMIKTTYTVAFGLREDKRRKAFEALLKKNKFEYSSSFGVPWNTLTAWVKEQIEVHKKSPPLKLLGATVERTAKLIKPKAERAKKAAADAKSTPKQRTK